jgi:hypothetical protein
MLANCRNGVSSYEVHRTIGVTQKSAWFMLRRLRMKLRFLAKLKWTRRSYAALAVLVAPRLSRRRQGRGKRNH